MEDDNLNVTITEKDGKKTYDIFFSPVEYHDVSYYIEGIYINSKIKGEKKDSIAFSESSGYNVLLENPELNDDSKVHVILEGVKEEIDYIKVLAKVNFNTYREFISYNPFIIKDEKEEETIPYEEIPASKDLISLKYNSDINLYKGNVINAFKIQKYKLEFDNIEKTSEYICVHINSTDNSINKIISFSIEDNDRKENRIQLAQTGTEKYVMD